MQLMFSDKAPMIIYNLLSDGKYSMNANEYLTARQGQR